LISPLTLSLSPFVNNHSFTSIVANPFNQLFLFGKTDQADPLLAGIKEIQGLLNQHDGTFLLGEKLSIGDLGVAPFVGRIFAAGKYGTLAFPCPRSLSFLSIFFPPVSLRVVLTFSFLLRSTGLQVSSPTPSKKLSPLPPSPPSERTTTP
jgi:hypothetical protein